MIEGYTVKVGDKYVRDHSQCPYPVQRIVDASVFKTEKKALLLAKDYDFEFGPDSCQVVKTDVSKYFQNKLDYAVGRQEYWAKEVEKLKAIFNEFDK